LKHCLLYIKKPQHDKFLLTYICEYIYLIFTHLLPLLFSLFHYHFIAGLVDSIRLKHCLLYMKKPQHDKFILRYICEYIYHIYSFIAIIFLNIPSPFYCRVGVQYQVETLPSLNEENSQFQINRPNRMEIDDGSNIEVGAINKAQKDEVDTKRKRLDFDDNDDDKKYIDDGSFIELDAINKAEKDEVDAKRKRLDSNDNDNKKYGKYGENRSPMPNTPSNRNINDDKDEYCLLSYKPHQIIIKTTTNTDSHEINRDSAINDYLKKVSHLASQYLSPGRILYVPRHFLNPSFMSYKDFAPYLPSSHDTPLPTTSSSSTSSDPKKPVTNVRVSTISGFIDNKPVDYVNDKKDKKDMNDINSMHPGLATSGLGGRINGLDKGDKNLDEICKQGMLPCIVLNVCDWDGKGSMQITKDFKSSQSATLPSATLPSATLPSAILPSVTLPSATLPSVALPSATLPPATLPSIPVDPLISNSFHIAPLLPSIQESSSTIKEYSSIAKEASSTPKEYSSGSSSNLPNNIIWKNVTHHNTEILQNIPGMYIPTCIK
jgi:hypothetical protein